MLELEILKKFGVEIKKKKASLKGRNAKTIIFDDFKLFDFSGNQIGIGQIEVYDFKELKERKEELLKALKEIAEKEKYTLNLLMATNIINKDSEILFFGEKKYLEKAFGKKIENNSLYLEDVMSRKKEIVPLLMKVFSKD